MCGKFTQMTAWGQIINWSDILASGKDIPVMPDAVTSVTPMRDAHVLHLDAQGARRVTRMRWGWSKPGSGQAFARPDHIHARAETIESRPTFRDAFRHRRGILLVKSFNAGQPVSASKTLQHVITPDDDKALAIAVLWTVDSRDDEERYAFVMITVPANTLIGAVTDRMPAILGPEDWSEWLGESPASPERLKALLRPVEGTWSMAREAKPTRAKPPSDPQLPL